MVIDTAAKCVLHFPRHQQGFSYIVVLMALTIFGLGLAVVEPRLADRLRREDEDTMIEGGKELASAIARYYLASPTTPKQYPLSLDRLVEDRRFAGMQRFVRRIPFDPLTRTYDWGVMRNEQHQIVGVFSRSDRRPLRNVPPDGVAGPENAERYSAWVFVGTIDDKGTK